MLKGYTEKMNSIYKNYCILRVVVGYLGEKHQFNWWNTSFLNDTGRKYLEFNFPRNTIAAGASGAGTAAKKLHDERIGKSRVFHLFRLPYEIEEEVHTCMPEMHQVELWDRIKSRETSMQALNEFAGSKIDAPEGPVKIGQVKHIVKDSGIAEIAKHYLSAFEKNSMTLPYFSGD